MPSLTDKVWRQLGEVETLTFVARSEADVKTGWAGTAHGIVGVEIESPSCIIFTESGAWRTPQGKEFEFTNVYRWQRDGERLRLEHLRFGVDRPVYLFDLVPDEMDVRMVSDQAHVCSEDEYRATLDLSDEISLKWSVVGPKLKENIDYTYSR